MTGFSSGQELRAQEPPSPPEDVAAARDIAPSGSALLRVGIRGLPWFLALGVAIGALLQTGTPALDILRYATYWGYAVILPGVLVARATVGTRGNWPEDVAIGAVTGLALELVCFALWSLVGLQQQIRLWPLLVVAAFLAVPRLRRHWRIGTPQPLPRLWSWGVASAIGASTLAVRQSAFSAPLPPAGGWYNQDVIWHLSVVHELTRALPPQVSQVAGEVMRYHWFSDAHLAAAHLVSGVPAATVVLRLWILPLIAVTALVGARLAMELSRVWWSGPVAAWALIVLTGTSLLPVLGEAGVVFATSPSQVYVLSLFLGAAILIVRALRGLRLGAGWVVLTLLLVAAAGAKPTAMPLVLAGTCLAALSLLFHRGESANRQWRAAFSVAAMVAAILPLSLLALSGSDGGSSIGAFDFVEWSPIYQHLTGAGIHPAVGPLLPEGLHDLSTRSMVILAILLLVPLVDNVGRLAPFLWMASRRLRRDPAAWFMAGVVVAGWVVYLSLTHPTYSQAYFLRLANPVASVFGACALAVAIPATKGGGRRVGVVLAGGTLLGAGVVTLGRALTPALPPLSALSANAESLNAVVASFVAPLVLLCSVTLVGLVVWVVARRRVPGLRGWGSGLVLAALVLGGPVGSAINGYVRNGLAFVNNTPVPQGGTMAGPLDGHLLSPGAGVAMAWVGQHTAQDAVVATNRHCVEGPERPGCRSFAFWVSGLGGRRTVLEGWAYAGGATVATAPTPYPARLADNDAVFTNPTATNVERLRRGFGASWLVADTLAGPVSSRLTRFAVPRFSSGEVTVYELR